jgi:hypothetical protein
MKRHTVMKISWAFSIIGLLVLCFNIGISQASTSFGDNFNTDSGLWNYAGSAYRDSTNQYLVLTDVVGEQGGAVFFRAPFSASFTASFDFKVGGGSGADGFTIFFYKQAYSSIGYGGNLGFHPVGVPVSGYGIEFDTWQNTLRIPSPPNEHGDSSANHIALIKDWVGNHLTSVNNPIIANNNWHTVTVKVEESSVKVTVDGNQILQWTGSIDRTYLGFGFSAATGGATNKHVIDNFSMILYSPIDLTVPETSFGTLTAIVVPMIAMITFMNKPWRRINHL